MKIIQITVVAVSVMVGIILGVMFCEETMRRMQRKNRELRAAIKEGRKPEKRETTKAIIWICLLMGFAWVWCSYYLAYTDHEQIAESLSQVAVTEIIGVVLAYCIKSAVENLSKNNRWPDKGEEDQEDKEPPENGGAG